MVASKRKVINIFEKLKSEGVTQEQLEQVPFSNRIGNWLGNNRRNCHQHYRRNHQSKQGKKALNNSFNFTQSQKESAYHQYLSTYGIERNEWRQMKEINRDEGGIEHYFKRGLDNFGLFHHLIIPEISNYICKKEHEQNLVKIFKGNAIIAQKLPETIKA